MTACSKVTFSNLENTFPYISSKTLSSNLLPSSVICGLCRSGSGAQHLAHLLSGDTASSIPRLHLYSPHPQRLSSQLSLCAGSLRPSGVTLKITPPQHKANKRRARAAGLPWLLSSSPWPGIPSGPRVVPRPRLLRPRGGCPTSRPHNGLWPAPHFIVPGKARAGRRGTSK